MGSKIDVNFERRFFNFFLQEKLRFLRSNRSKLGAKMDQKSIKNRVQNTMHLGIDFERCWWILGAKLGPSWRQVGLKHRWKMNPKRLGRFHIALGTFQEAPERETLIFHWFWEVWVERCHGCANLAPQIYQHHSKIDAKMHCILHSIF